MVSVVSKSPPIMVLLMDSVELTVSTAGSKA